MSDAKADVAPRRRIAAIWIVPLIAVVLGFWMLWFTFQNQGPEITILFETAEGIEAGQTKIKARSVVVGLVSSVGLTNDLARVVVVADLDKDAAKLLREDSEFWVVRPRVGAGGITGLGTIVSGGYIELAPGTGKAADSYRFKGRDDPPVTPVGAPGLRLTLVSGQARSVSAGDPILYRGFRVGRVETAEFEVATQEVRYDAFIEEPYHTLITTGTRFWNVSGVHFSATAEGIELSTGSLQSLLIGGVTFGVPDEADPGLPATNGALFKLYESEPQIHEVDFRESVEYVVQFSRSVRGLKPGAPVEYRGLRAGTVVRILLEELIEEDDVRADGGAIPVLIRIDPGRISLGDDAAGREQLEERIARGITRGLRATLATGNFLTGSQYVALDRYPDAAPAEQGRFAGRPTIPTVASGFEGLQYQASALLEKLNALPVENVVGSADETLQELNRAVAALNTVLSSDGVQSLPDQLELTLAELDRTLRRVSDLAASLESQPSSLIFSRTPEPDPEPGAGIR